MKTDIPVPARIAKLPQYKGIFIPALTFVDENGIPNFKMTNDKVWQMKKERRCGLCGEPLDYWIAFMVTPDEAEARFINESPNHEECLRYAFSVCPWLYYSKAKYSDAEKIKADGYLVFNTHPDRDKGIGRPEKLGIYICNDYKNEIRNRYRGCRVPKAKRLEWIDGH